MELDMRPFPFFVDSAGDRLMFCFHHAGGTASVYRHWVERDPRVVVVPVELPGKATRMREPWIDDFSPLSRNLADNIHLLAHEAPVVLYGHSMGAALAYQCAAHLQESHHHVPLAVVVAARQAPGRVIEGEYRSCMGLAALREELVKVGGTPPEILADDDLMGVLLPGVRRDYALHESFRHTSTVLRCPILALAGSEDSTVTPQMMEEWSQFTSSSFVLKTVPGGHFFPMDFGVSFLEDLVDDIDQIAVGDKWISHWSAVKE
ncbi:alpha/beta fold hydrolase [Actinomyces viscosus]|uniref:thioesterase II family protein n=1 Tax=Actinomyces viscosus TaxID=1656 RepID=UPI0028E8496B|nr:MULTISPECIES: alpha/beta fold hydrolase [Actinomyces]